MLSYQRSQEWYDDVQDSEGTITGGLLILTMDPGNWTLDEDIVLSLKR